MPPVLRLDMHTDVRELDEVQAAIADRVRHNWPTLDQPGLDDRPAAVRLRRRLVWAARRHGHQLTTRITYDDGTYRVAFIVKEMEEDQ